MKEEVVEEVKEEVTIGSAGQVHGGDWKVGMEEIFGKDTDDEEEEEEEEEEEDIHLLPEMRVTIDEVEYYKTRAFGLDNFLFSYPSGDEVGVYNESTGTIEDVMFE